MSILNMRVIQKLICFAFVLCGVLVSSVAIGEVKNLPWVYALQPAVTEEGRYFVVKGVAPKDHAGNLSARSLTPNVSVSEWEERTLDDGRVAFEFRLVSPEFESGGYFRLNVGLDDGNQYMPLAWLSGESLALHIQKTHTRHWQILAAVVLVIGLGLSRHFQGCSSKLAAWVEKHQKRLALGMGVVALALVAAGWTGSSWRLLVKSPGGESFMETSGSDWQMYSGHLDRWDEWGVITPGVFAQLNHDPKFPVLNTHIGPEGQNMGVMGMFGVPVKQMAAMARPATWGYFVLPLRQAMSWQWQIQFWGCLLAVWWFLNLLKTGQSGRNLALATVFCMAPYAVGWSNWPLYASLFPVLGMCLLMQVLRTQHFIKAALMGIALGWAFSCWVLVLYPPWLVIVGSLCAMLMLGWMVDHRKALRWGAGQWLALLLALLVAGGLLGSWWMDTRDAVAQVQATVYPGGRQTELGGIAPLPWAMRGYMALEVFLGQVGPEANRPEVSSYFFVPLAMAAILVWGLVKVPKARGVWLGLAAFVAVYWWYSFLGFPFWLASVTKWGVLTTNRMDLGLGLALVILVCLLPSPSLAKDGPRTDERQITQARYGHTGLGGLLAVGSAVLAWWALGKIHPDVLPFNPLPYRAAIALLCAAMAWWMWKRQTASLILALLAAGFGAAFTYTPVSKAPRAVWLTEEVKPFVNEAGRLAKTLVVDETSLPAVTLAALGVPVVNGALYYPHRSMWDNMQLPAEQWPVVNRYQHLTFVPDRQVDETLHYRVTTPRMDAVTVFFDPKAFDFKRTGAERVAAHQIWAEEMAHNPHLERLGGYRQYVWFRVK